MKSKTPSSASPRMSRKPAPDVAIIEIGGTVGDIEGLPFLEAIRQLRSNWAATIACTSI
ncbi:MAG: hypothetical protein ACLSHC_08930 [Bilophila wadsworthia]